MNPLLRLTALAAMLGGLSGCNTLVSDEPWFTEADAQPRPTLRDGLWLSAEPDCRVTAARPAERWPDCASASFVRGQETWSMRWDDTDERGRRRKTFAGWELADPHAGWLLVANGDHLIVQQRASVAEATTPPSREGDREARGSVPPNYTYGALRLLGQDEEGKATAMEFWLVQCGPLPEQLSSRRQRRRARTAETATAQAGVTDRPFPGLTVVDDNCTAESVDAVRNAAVLSEALEPPMQMRWVRPGWH